MLCLRRCMEKNASNWKNLILSESDINEDFFFWFLNWKQKLMAVIKSKTGRCSKLFGNWTCLWLIVQQLASHGLFDVHVRATGDIHIDDHHTNEDVALAIGTVLPTAAWYNLLTYVVCLLSKTPIFFIYNQDVISSLSYIKSLHLTSSVSCILASTCWQRL